jgi:hypothetical protein
VRSILAVASFGLAAAGPAAAANGSTPGDPIAVVVYDCYTTTPALEIELDGRKLALVAREKRNDSVALCYDGTLAFKPSAHIAIRRGGVVRTFDLRLTRRTRTLGISAQSLSAIATDKIMGFD